MALKMHKLQYQRKRKGFSQEDMAKKLGLSVHGYRKYELGIRKLSVEMALKIVKILQVSHIEDILDEAS